MPSSSLYFPNDETKSNIYACLREWILYTKFKPGQRLNERDLAERFGISRTPLREILQRLAQQGLLIIRPRNGVFVAPIDPENVRQVFEVRLPLEKTVARLATQRASDAEIAELRDLAEHSAEAMRSGRFEEGIRVDAVFHDTLAKDTRNEVLRRTREALHNICLRYWFLILDRYRPDEADILAHQRLVEAMLRRDAAAAAEIHGAHVSHFVELLDGRSYLGDLADAK